MKNAALIDTFCNNKDLVVTSMHLSCCRFFPVIITVKSVQNMKCSINKIIIKYFLHDVFYKGIEITLIIATRSVQKTLNLAEKNPTMNEFKCH